MTDSGAAARAQRHVVVACYLGWTLDAFDFFIMVFVLRDIAAAFGTDFRSVTWALTLTLAMRAPGALLFGRLADRFGRRPTLIGNVLLYSLVEFASGFAPDLAAFLVLRGLYGLAMGGEWGVGASLTMESIPTRWRGAVSGLLQAGYPSGYLLAAIVYLVVPDLAAAAGHPALAWRLMFMVGVLPALLVLYIRRRVPESPDWRRRRAARPPIGLWAGLRGHLGRAVHAVLMMTAFNFFSHGTQDLYPSAFLAGQHRLPHATVSLIAIVYNIGAMLGGICFGTLSQRVGRRAAIVAAALLALPVIPLWAFSTTPVRLGIGAFLMQFCVQGAWGVVPAHINEISPPAIRGTFPGLVYQLGNLLAAGNATIQATIAAAMGQDYRFALAGTVAVVAVAIALLVGFGGEARELPMAGEAGEAAAPAPAGDGAADGVGGTRRSG